MNNLLQDTKKTTDFNYIVLITLDNSSNIHLILQLKNFNIIADQMKIERYARFYNNSARVIGVIRGNFISTNNSKLFYGKELINKKQFIEKIKYSFDPRDDFQETMKIVDEMEIFLKNK